MEFQVFTFLSFFYFVNSKYVNLNSGCAIDPFINKRSPLLINQGTTTMIYPKPNSKVINFLEGETSEIICPGGKVTANGFTLTSNIIKCISKETFQVEKTTIKWSDISCTNNIKPDIKEVKYSDLPESSPNINCNDPTLRVIKIGFKLDKDRFVSLIDVCFDSKTQLARYSYSILESTIDNHATKVDSPGFKQDSQFYISGLLIKQLYSNNQSTINYILNLDSASTKYVNKQSFLNRGHLSPKADFVYAGQQLSTYRYINAAPQWSSFNGGNWNTLENDIRKYASKNRVSFQIWTGTYGVATLKNEKTNNITNLYLYIANGQSPALPVPKVYWKLVYDSDNQKGVIFVGHNNPYEEITEKNQMICDEDVSGCFSWVHWDKKNIMKGYSYACRTSDNKFLSLVPVVPRLFGVDLLT